MRQVYYRNGCAIVLMLRRIRTFVVSFVVHMVLLVVYVLIIIVCLIILTMLLIKMPLKNMGSKKLSEINDEAQEIVKEFRTRLMSQQVRTLKRSSSLNTKVSKMAQSPPLKRSKSLDTCFKKYEKASQVEMKHFELPKSITINVRANMDSKSLALLLLKIQKYFKKDIKASKILKKATGHNCIPAHKFIELVNIILKQIDIHFEVLTIANYVQLLPAIMERLLYPRAVTPNMIKTVHTTQSWPLVLQILSWLADLRLQIEASRGIIQKYMFALPTDLPEKKLRELKIQQAQARTLVATYSKSKKGQSIKKELDVFVKDLRQIYNYHMSEAIILKNNIETFFSNNKIVQLAAQKQKEVMEEEQNQFITLVQERKNLQSTILSKSTEIRKLQQKIADMKNSNKMLKEKNYKQMDTNHKLELILKKQNQDQGVENAESPAVDSNVKIEQTDIDEESNVLEEKHLHIKQKIAKQIFQFNVAIQRESLQFKDFSELLIKDDILQSKTFIQDIMNNISKGKEIYRHILDNAEIEETAVENLQQINSMRLKSITLIRNQREQMNATLRKLLEKTDYHVAQNVTEEYKKSRQIDCLITKISFIRAQIPDINELTSRFNQKLQYMRSLQNHFRISAYHTLEAFENMERDVVHNIAPEYKLIREQIMENMKMRQNYEPEP